jgi:Uma2 family endonuclease
MQTAQKLELTAREYLDRERKAEFKSEFLNGEVFAMSGGTDQHSLIAMNLGGELRAQLKGKPCRVYNSDMRVKIEATGLYTYPDVPVACGELRFEDETRDVLLNPKIIVEVLSESTAAWDRGEKFWHYSRLESLTEYVLVSQQAWLVEHRLRQPDGTWLIEQVEGQQGVLSLPTIDCKVPLAEIYANTGLDPAAKPTRGRPRQK